ncbi:MAG: GIY-YIG nuclease family protein [Enhydrobacter sp.]|nr:MAG: GIY-YIG nuclease family protein [Enhydrobacter sp.]
MELRDQILTEIRRLAEANGGRPPGRDKFEQATGIKYAQWSGVFWARWGDALAEAGFKPNTLNPRHDTEAILSKLVDVVRHYARWPTWAEMRLYRQRDPSFPTDKTIARHFPGRPRMLEALKRRASEDASTADILPLLPAQVLSGPSEDDSRGKALAEGWVYLIKSGSHYKIGRGENLERRVKEIRVALPETGTLVHAIRTDDPAGIENYWHRRFASQRANGEWFRLSSVDVTAFKRRKFQ